MTINKHRFPRLAKLADKHEKKCEEFMLQQAAFFHPHAVALCEKIRKGIPEFEGCELAMRHLYLNPMDLQIPVVSPDGEETTERLTNLLDGGYLDDDGSNSWKVKLPKATQDAMRELDELANYIDDNYSMVAELSVTLAK